MPLKMEQITANKLRALDADRTVIFFPVSGLEDHGPHLPLGLDLIEATDHCWTAAEKLENDLTGWTGIVMPAAPLGIDVNTRIVTILVRSHVLRDWIVDASYSLVKLGFSRFVCFSGTVSPRQLTAVEEAARMLRQKTGMSIFRRLRFGKYAPTSRFPTPLVISATSATVDWQLVLRSPLWPKPTEHGGERDTSVALALVPDWVDPGYERLVERGPSQSGYWGRPARASIDQGRSELRRVQDLIFPKLQRLLEGRGSTRDFRSHYTLFPPNWSFFRGWILIFGIVILMMLWLYINFKNLIG